MARFEVDVKMIVEADDDMEAFHVAASAIENLVCGSITDATVEAATDLSMEANNG